MDLIYKNGKDKRHQTPLNGRFLCYTNSPTIELLEPAKMFCHPLPSALYGKFLGEGLTVGPGLGYAFVLEAQGYLLTEAGSVINLHQTDEYTRFDFLSLDVNNICFPPYTEVDSFVSKTLLRQGVPVPPRYSAWQIEAIGTFPGFTNPPNRLWVPKDINTLNVDPKGLSVAAFLGLYNAATLPFNETSIP